MNLQTAKYRQYICPSDVQGRLTDVGGVNRYDEPNFLLVWSQGGGEHATFRAGGAWHVEGLPPFEGYRNLLVGGGVPCWALLQWHDSIEYGTPESYYVLNYDEATGLQTLGEYPYSGRYQLLYNLRYTEKRGNALHFEAMPLNSYLIDTVVPIIKQAKNIGWEKTKAAMEELKAREDQADTSKIEDVMRDKAVPFRYSTVSFNKAGCRTDLIDKKVESMLRNWNTIMRRSKSMTKGVSVKDEVK